MFSETLQNLFFLVKNVFQNLPVIYLGGLILVAVVLGLIYQITKR
jgi:hypothetical protein